MGEALTMDHIAIGVRDHRQALGTLTGPLGGQVISGGHPPKSGFRAMQIRLGHGLEGMTVEVLEPADVEYNDFLERFLASGGDRPHHMTFKTDDIEVELERLRSKGTEPMAIDFSDPGWREMFIHPADAHGTVIQIAETNMANPPMDTWLDGLPETMFMYEGRRWWDDPTPAEAAPAVLRRVVITTPDRAAGDRFYTEILGSDASQGAEYTDHHWSGGTVRLVDANVDRASVGWLEIAEHEQEVAIGSARFVPEGT